MRLDTSLGAADFLEAPGSGQVMVVDEEGEEEEVEEEGRESGAGLQEYHTRFHRAAIDGYVDMLCDVSKRDANLASKCSQLTPTLLAAYHGHLEALRMLVGRGGDPEKGAADGSNALHLAASRNHLNCVSFLVNFGVNMWALDDELHTAKDIAAMLQRKEILDYLDQMMAKQSALNTKNVQKLKEKAKVAAERRLKKLRKAQLRAIKLVEKDERYLAKLSNSRRLLKSAHSISDIKLVEKPAPAEAPTLNNREQKLSLRSGCATGGSSSVLSNGSSSLANLIRCNLLGRAKQAHLARQVPSGRPSTNSPRGSCSSSSLFSSSCNLSTSGSSSNSSEASSHLTAQVEAQTGGLRSDSAMRRPRLTAMRPGGEPCLGVSRKLQLQQQRRKNQHQQHDGRSGDDVGFHTKEQGAAAIKPANQLIKWPPAPLLSRTISEPDFGAASLRASDEADEDDGLMAAGMQAGAECCSVSSEQKESPAQQANRVSVAFADQRDTCQHQLLTKCLSQLKLHHETINKQQQEQQSHNDNQQAEDRCGAKQSAPRNPTGGRSDELLQLKQLNQDCQPLRPSAIKHNQQLHYPQPALLAVAAAATTSQPSVSKSATISVDSIGSAGSFAHRNASTCQSASSSASSSSTHTYCKSRDLTCSSTCSSTRASSIEARLTKRQPAADSIESFLSANGLADLFPVFASEKIDLEALVLLTEADLKSLNILLGPRRKLLKALEGLQQGYAHQLPVYLMMDTQL